MKNIVVLASGSGSNFQSILDAIQSGIIENAIVTGLIAGRPGIRAIERAESAGIPVAVLPEAGDETQMTNTLTLQLGKWKPDLIVLAGFLKKIPEALVKQYRNKIINIHPSLLPKFGGKGYYGLKVHKAVIASGETDSGCTVHFVTEEYDEGDIIRQVRVHVNQNDTPETLAARILAEEHKLLPAVINDLLNSNSY